MIFLKIAGPASTLKLLRIVTRDLDQITQMIKIKQLVQKLWQFKLRFDKLVDFSRDQS